ncbi:MAG: DUF4159 domain-containing protein [Candidatus Poribacteria bacterium]|nr:DUF4159 domain-containing protein [Candidatus Poribacteria bacterium]
MTQNNKRQKKTSSSAFMISLAVHLFLAFYAAYQIANTFERNRLSSDETMAWTVEVKEQTRRRFNFQKPTPRREPRPPDPFTKNMETPSATHQQIIAASPGNAINDVVSQDIEAVSDLDLAPELTTEANLPTAPSSLGEGRAQPLATPASRSAAAGRNLSRTQVQVKGGSLDNLRGNILADIENISPSALTQMIPHDQLGAVLIGKGKNISGQIRLIRIKHSLSDWWQDPTAMNSLIEWLATNTKLRADIKFEGGALRLDDDRILDAPFLIMTGHDKDITASRDMARGGPLVSELSDEERQNLREYLVDRKGTLFFDDCGFNGVFAAQIRRELKEIMPEHDLVDLPHNHELYTIYYELSGPPDGGDVFWGSENKAQASKFKTHKAILIEGRIAVLFNRKDYMCAMETVEVRSRTMLRMRRSTDVYRFMTNLFIYAMKYGGNVNRFNFDNAGSGNSGGNGTTAEGPRETQPLSEEP